MTHVNELEKVLTKELNALVKTESLGKYHSLDDIPIMNRALCTMKIGITLLLALVAVYVVMHNSPILLMIGLFPYDMTFMVFAKIMEYTLVFCVTTIILYFCRKTCHDGIEIETKILKGTFVTPTPTLMAAYRDAKRQMDNNGIECEDWEHKTLVSLGEISDFIELYKKL